MKCKTTLATLLFVGALPLAVTAADSTTQPSGSGSPGSSTTESSSPTTGREDTVPSIFKDLDTNKDGYVSRDEAKRSAEATARFSEMDTDRDGRIAAAEYKKGMQPKM